MQEGVYPSSKYPGTAEYSDVVVTSILRSRDEVAVNVARRSGLSAEINIPF
jgi:hypothetical protein